jgi:glycosyltransferase involved in cell wall biosynthesis
MNTPSNQPLVSVGIPTYNRPQGLRRTLECMTNQSYTNLEIIVSDNCSPGKETQDVVKEFANKDPRIKYYRQENNKGLVFNFKFLLDKATGDFFIWASDDDLWENNFIDTGVKTLIANPFYQAWFCTIDNIDRLDRVIRDYVGFSRYSSTKDKKNDIVRYLEEPGLPGKANLIHGLFQKEAIKTTADEYFFNDSYASDVVFNLAFLVRFNLIATDEILSHKRVVRKSIEDKPDKIVPIVPKRPNRTMKPKRAIRYIYECYKATRTTKYKKIVLFTLVSQMPKIILNGMQERFDSICNSIKKRL